MGGDKIRHVRWKKYRWLWEPTRKMHALGFRPVNLGKELTADARAKALGLNAEWDKARRSLPVNHALAPAVAETYPRRTLGFAFEEAMRARAAERANAGKPWTKEQTKRDDWPRAFKWIKEFGIDRADPRTVKPAHFLGLDSKGKPIGFIRLIEAKSATERHRFIKVWRALWKRMARQPEYGLREEHDPSRQFANTAPPPRQVLWLYDEVVMLVDHAWATERKGLAALMATTWDTMMSPIDVRTLTRAQMMRDGDGAIYFDMSRTKTGAAGAGTLTPWSQGILETYLAGLNVTPMSDMPLFYTPGSAPGPNGGRRYLPQPYSKDLVEQHFADVRAEVFGKAERRQLADMRRSGAIEGDAGGASVEDQSNKMANTVAANKRLRRTYNPVNLVSVHRFDEARQRGRERLADVVTGGTSGGAKRAQIANMADEKVAPSGPKKLPPPPRKAAK
jgi:hypothetical protein